MPPSSRRWERASGKRNKKLPREAGQTTDEAEKLEHKKPRADRRGGPCVPWSETPQGGREQPDNINFYRDLVSHYRKAGRVRQRPRMDRKGGFARIGAVDVKTSSALQLPSNGKRMQSAIRPTDEASSLIRGRKPRRPSSRGCAREERAFRLEQAEHLVQRYPMNSLPFRVGRAFNFEMAR